MSTLTVQSPAGLVNALLEHFPLKDHEAYSLQIRKNQAVIQVVHDEITTNAPTSENDTPESRRQDMLEWIRSIATPAGLSDEDISREAIYSPDK